MTLDNLVDDESNLCSHCGANLQGKAIPQEHRKHLLQADPSWDRSIHTSHEDQVEKYGHCFCFPYGESHTHFSRTIGVEIQGIYDGVLFWACPDCGKTWHRWKLGDMRTKAEPYMRQWEQKHTSIAQPAEATDSKPVQ